MTTKEVKIEIPLNQSEQTLILGEMQTILKGKEARHRYQLILSGIAIRAGYNIDGKPVTMSEDLSNLIVIETPRET